MDYDIRDTGTVHELALRGRLTFDSNERFRTIVDTLTAGKPRSLRIDVSQLEFIDSAGLGMLLLLKESQSGPVILRAPQGQVKRLLAAARFDSLMTIEDGQGA
ncbi:STAS domain-containing protein [Telmatospirillum siberiense]|uniref:STAS domain-containing protein n=1 Tax=Telmatospirillum siberiense TaxID=382514 RepID=UPI0013046CAB|nr:STAS domain-containing protein [Telmatospirillum siberiense]